MDFITIPAVVAMITWGIYKIFELFARRKERFMIIEKIDFSRSGDLQQTVNIGNIGEGGNKFFSLKFGCLLAGIGLGLLVGFFITSSMNISGLYRINANDTWQIRYLSELVIGASVLLFGGAAMLVSFLIEQKISKK